MLASHKYKAAKKSAMLISFCSFLLSFQQRCSLYLIELCLKRTVAISSALRKWLACRLATSGPLSPAKPSSAGKAGWACRHRSFPGQQAQSCRALP